MSTFPTSPSFVTTNTDAGSDSPAAARADLLNVMNDVAAIIDSAGLADGTAVLDAAGKIPQAQVPITPIATGRWVRQQAGTYTFTVPAGVYSIEVEVWGAGGGGGFTANGAGVHGGGGGAGGGAFKIWAVNPADALTVVVGGGGAGSPGGTVTDTDGTAGADSTVTLGANTITGKGGNGGKSATNGSVGGSGGIHSGAAADDGIEGGVGTSGITGRGGAGGSNSITGSSPATTGYGGGGGGYGGGGAGAAAAGRDGYVRIRW